MKLARASRGPANRNEAWACAMTNLALPGAGSLAAGRVVGYSQLAVAAAGFLLSLASGARLLNWMMSNWARINNPNADPFQSLLLLWREIRWPLAGLALFFLALAWASWTSYNILSAFPKHTVPPPPPILRS